MVGAKGLFVLVTWLSSVFRELPALLNWRGIHLEGPAAPPRELLLLNTLLSFQLKRKRQKFSRDSIIESFCFLSVGSRAKRDAAVESSQILFSSPVSYSPFRVY